MTKRIEPGRLAFRVEGKWWNAYYALPDTMDGAIHLGGILFAAATKSAETKRRFMDLMRGVVADAFKDVATDVLWGAPRPGPEHERSGRA